MPPFLWRTKQLRTAGEVLGRGYKQNKPIALVGIELVAIYFVARNTTHRKK